ncbi:DUF3429 domain-containing protein [Salinivibrio sp. IB643]|uniref:DUF3429 domain-containing protein n=1 Tax=Salinivibrio sp. IB643 TaxID=1909445 RepID=UPI0009CEB7D6|nr:DUF3429 domain-containing protein [Salinivibrio sp. IB643]OOE98493.1 hypothetical protein BZG77_06460 [Salinivibrio sp. IB643]
MPQPDVRSSSSERTMLNLGYLGLLPFAGALVVSWTGLTVFGLAGEQLFITYSAVILSFLSGVLWGSGLDNTPPTLSRYALVLSNVFALLAWGALVKGATPLSLTVSVLTAGYFFVWLTERWIRHRQQKNDQPAGYQTMRDRLTLSVVAFHGLLPVIA